MGCDIDTIDYGLLFSGLPYPACVLEPVIDERNGLLDVSFGRMNDAFKMQHKEALERRGLISFLCNEGFDGSNLLRALNRMRPGERKSLSIETAIKAKWFECAVTRSTTRNYLIVASCAAYRGERSGQGRKESVYIPAFTADVPALPESSTPEDREAPLDKRGNQIDLRAFGLFLEAHADIPYLRELIVALSSHGALASYAKGDHFLETGSVQTTAGLVLKGLFRQYRISPDGKDCTLFFYRAGAIIDSYPDYRLQRPSSAAYEAMTDCLVFCADFKTLASLALKDHRWYRLFFYNANNRHMNLKEQGYSLRFEDALTRYRRFLTNYRDILPFVKSYHIASFLGITSETLSRVRKSLAENNSIQQ